MNNKGQPSRPRKVAIYIRVSTSYQADKDSLPMQRNDLIAYSSLILGINDYVIFEDAGYSGKNTDRPSYQEMMARIRKNEFSHLLVWKIDRISRNLLDFAEMFEELQELRVTFVSKNEQFDTSNAMGEAMLKIILVFAELERNMTSERVTATMISRASGGKWNGGRIPFGYNYDPDTEQFSINEEEAAICRMLRDDYIKYRSLIHTTRLLNGKGYTTREGKSWSPAGCWLIAQSPFYAGIYRYNKYKGTERRYINPESEWVMVYDHHPAIFTLEEHQTMAAIRNHNARTKNTVGSSHIGKYTYVFGDLCYCGKCGSRMVTTPGRLHTDGYRTAHYSCPLRRKSKACTQPTVNDLIIGEFLINYILNMMNAKTSFSQINGLEDLQKKLLHGRTFSSVASIDRAGLTDFYNILTRYKSDQSFSLSLTRPPSKAIKADPETESLHREKERQERALKRLQTLFLYSDTAMSERDFIIRKKEITDQIEAINRKLGMVSPSASSTLSDEDFVKLASHLLISSYLTSREYINYKNLVMDVSPDVLREYMTAIIDSFTVNDGHVASVTFKNGLRNSFVYRADISSHDTEKPNSGQGGPPE